MTGTKLTKVGIVMVDVAVMEVWDDPIRAEQEANNYNGYDEEGNLLVGPYFSITMEVFKSHND